MNRQATLSMIAIGLFPLLASAETVIVDPNGFFDFTTIQAAIDYSLDGDTVIVRPSTYNESITFNGRRVTLTSLDPNEEGIVDSTIINGATTVTFNFGEDTNSVITGFTIIGSSRSIECYSCSPSIVKNKITGNCYGILKCGGIIANNIISNSGTGVDCRKEAIIRNNTIINNTSRGILLTGASIPPTPPVITIKNNIIANNNEGIYCANGYAISDNSYNCFWNNNNNFGGIASAGIGDFLRDPLFAAGSDYHLRSAAGRYNPDTETWILDDVNSPCIDAGDPCDPIGVEPNPNGGRINMGAYGGTAEASKSPSGISEPICTNPPSMDTNNDCKIDFIDFAEFASQWMDCGLDPQSACWE